MNRIETQKIPLQISLKVKLKDQFHILNASSY